MLDFHHYGNPDGSKYRIQTRRLTARVGSAFLVKTDIRERATVSSTEKQIFKIKLNRG